MTPTHSTFTIAPSGLARAGFGLRATWAAVKADDNFSVLAASGAG